MNSEDNQNIDELTQFLLNKCEVSSLTQFYHKWVRENNHNVLIKKICSIHKNFNENKVLLDVNNLADLLHLDIPNYSRKNDLTRRKYLVDYIGLGRMLNSFKRKKIIEKSVKMSDLYRLLGIQELQKEKVIDMVNQCINERMIYAALKEVSANTEEKDYLLNFYNKLKHPDNIKEFKKLIVTIIIGLLVVSILLPVIFLINA